MYLYQVLIVHDAILKHAQFHEQLFHEKNSQIQWKSAVSHQLCQRVTNTYVEMISKLKTKLCMMIRKLIARYIISIKLFLLKTYNK